MQIAWDQKDGRTFLCQKINNNNNNNNKKKKIETTFTEKYF